MGSRSGLRSKKLFAELREGGSLFTAALYSLYEHVKYIRTIYIIGNKSNVVKIANEVQRLQKGFRGV